MIVDNTTEQRRTAQALRTLADAVEQGKYKRAEINIVNLSARVENPIGVTVEAEILGEEAAEAVGFIQGNE